MAFVIRDEGSDLRIVRTLDPLGPGIGTVEPESERTLNKYVTPHGPRHPPSPIAMRSASEIKD